MTKRRKGDGGEEGEGNSKFVEERNRKGYVCTPQFCVKLRLNSGSSSREAS
jgi:hypothetical protein